MSVIFGITSGALLGFGPLLKYKSEGLLSISMGTVDYKRINDFAHNSHVLREYLALNPMPDIKNNQLERLAQDLIASEWSRPVPTLSKLDIKELPSLPKDKDQIDAKAYLGVVISAVAKDPIQAATVARWLGIYYKDAATLDAVRDLVNRWAAENIDLSNRALEEKIKLDFSITQVQSRAAALKQLMARYPNTSIRDNQQVLDVRKDNEKFMSPLAQLVAAESEIISLQQDVRKLEREMAQYAFAKKLAAEVALALQASRTGSESTANLAKVVQKLSQQPQTDAEQEKLLAFAAELSEIQTRFLSRAQFIADPSVPTRPQGLGPLKTMALMGFMAMLISAAWVMRKTLLKLLQDDAESSRPSVSSAG